jgi:hypothetical protein
MHSLGYYGDDHDDDGRLFLEGGGPGSGKKRARRDSQYQVRVRV